MSRDETVGKVLTINRRPRRSGSGFGLNLKERWIRMLDAFRRRPKILWMILAAVPIGWVLFDFVTFSFGTLPILPGTIEIIGTRRLTPDAVRSEIYRKLRSTNADNLMEVDVTDMSEHVLKTIPAVRSAVVTKNIGRGTMTVVVAERTGIAAIRGRVGKLEVDKEGMLYQMGGSPPSELPDVSGLVGSAVTSGRNIAEHPAGAGLLRMIAALRPGFSPKLKSIRVVSSDYFELTFAGDMIVKADPATFPFKIDTLQRILRKIQQRPDSPANGSDRSSPARPVQYIDVRFQQDVIAYSNEPVADRRISSGPAPVPPTRSDRAVTTPLTRLRPDRGMTQGR